MAKGPERAVVQVYATAVYEAAQEAGELDRVRSEVEAFSQVFSKEPKLQVFFDSPTISFEAKRSVIESTTSSMSTRTRNFLLILVKKGRISALGGIVEELEHHADELAGIAKVDVKTAIPLEDSHRNRIIATLKVKLGKDVRLSESIEPSILGGMILNHENKQWNASLFHRLERATKAMAEVKGSHGAWTE